LQPTSNRKSIFSKFSVSQTICSETEDTQYCNSPTDSETLPEMYWSKMSATYPRLAKLARSLLSIPASSGSVERLFSISGSIVRARRSRLTAKAVEALLMAMEYNDGF
jgi:hAT family C-terminal dimerisation region